MTSSHFICYVVRFIDDLLSFWSCPNFCYIIEAEFDVVVFCCCCSYFSRQGYYGFIQLEQTYMTPKRLRAGCSIR